MPLFQIKYRTLNALTETDEPLFDPAAQVHFGLAHIATVELAGEDPEAEAKAYMTSRNPRIAVLSVDPT